MQQDLIGYDEIIENSMRSVIYEALKKVETKGLLGQHYFIITFLTRFSGVEMSKELMEKYPEEMTIAIQYQYRNLVVEHDNFKISLSFAGKYEKILIPYKSITSFSDPSMSFALKFSIHYNEDDSSDLIAGSDSNQANKNLMEEKSESSVDLSAKVVSLEAFRKNKGNNTDK